MIRSKHKIDGRLDLDETLKALERSYIEAALRLTHGNMSRAAKLLGVKRPTLYGRMGSEGKETGGHHG